MSFEPKIVSIQTPVEKKSEKPAGPLRFSSVPQKLLSAFRAYPGRKNALI
jgi:hypothetical protein